MKDYKKILEGIVNIINTTEKSDIGFANICTYIGEICPEFIESEEERIKKEIIEYIKTGTYHKNWIDWLEKQNKSIKIKKDKNYLCTKTHKYAGLEWIEGIKYYSPEDYSLVNQGCTYYCSEYNKEEHNNFFKEVEYDGCLKVDKTKLKFKVGDWVIFNENHNSVYQVERIANNLYHLRHYLGGTLSVHFDNELIRLWTVQDAKEGDVLIVGDEDGTGIAICGKNDMLGNNVLHCYYDNENDFAINVPISSACLLHPATKEQRDALFKIITENGYKWDNVKKYLKKK